jgi:sensor histidine kinase YesM
MTIRNRMSIIMLVVAGLLIAAGDKFAGMILLSLLLPVYGSAISNVSLFFLVAVTRFFRRPGS